MSRRELIGTLHMLAWLICSTIWARDVPRRLHRMLGPCLARSPIYYEAARSSVITAAYRKALERVFGEAWRDGHWLVKGWTT